MVENANVVANVEFLIAVPTFIAFLREVESPIDVMEYVTDYLGDGKEIKNFVKQFLDRRSGVVANTGVAALSSTTVVTSVMSATSTKKSKKKPEEGVKMPAKQPLAKANSLEFTEVKVSFYNHSAGFFHFVQINYITLVKGDKKCLVKDEGGTEVDRLFN